MFKCYCIRNPYTYEKIKFAHKSTQSRNYLCTSTPSSTIDYRNQSHYFQVTYVAKKKPIYIHMQEYVLYIKEKLLQDYLWRKYTFYMKIRCTVCNLCIFQNNNKYTCTNIVGIMFSILKLISHYLWASPYSPWSTVQHKLVMIYFGISTGNPKISLIYMLIFE